MNAHDIGLFEQSVKRQELRPDLLLNSARGPHRVVIANGRLKSLSQAGDLLADSAKADKPQRLAAEFTHVQSFLKSEPFPLM